MTNYLSKALLNEQNVRILRLADCEDDIVANVTSISEDAYYVHDPMVINVIPTPQEMSTEDGDEVKVVYSPTVVFSPYVMFAAQNITMSFKMDQVELCIPPRIDIVKGYIRSIVNLRAECFGKSELKSSNLQ